jgi:hypothetical protein
VYVSLYGSCRVDGLLALASISSLVNTYSAGIVKDFLTLQYNAELVLRTVRQATASVFRILTWSPFMIALLSYSICNICS